MSAGEVCACGWLCHSHKLRGWLGPGGSGDRAGRKDPPPHLGRQDCVVVWLPTPPPVTWAYGQWLPLFVCPPPRGGDRDLSSCLVLSPPDGGGEVCYYRLRALVSATLWAVLLFRHFLVSGTPSQWAQNGLILIVCAPQMV